MVDVDERSDAPSVGAKGKIAKPYLSRLKRHQDAVLALYSPGGLTGTMICSGSADEKLRVWDMDKKTISKAIPFDRPTDDRLMKYRNMANDSLPRFSTSNMVDMELREEQKRETNPRPDSGGDQQ